MTRDETKTILAMMSAVYPPNLMPVVTEMTVNVWYQLMQDIPYNLVQSSVAAWLQTNRYPPTIADLRERLVRHEIEQGNTAEQAWSKLQTAVRKFGHTEPDRAEEFLGELWQMAGNDWNYYCQLEEPQIPNEKARFIRMYAVQQNRAKEKMQISAPVRAALDAMIKRIGEGT